ncbi:hypothetical protein TSAR_003463 [Trichomalopsis sarcophagae]|uniref:Peptidase S1 domain-containing protein n=1 Tax=Trichomalopsis sarcophagae TaxID=543379 RepID=A0A232EQ17_9HYME|nr:hypothetical protein TSAR_003463 [Trichomalopsis sarcophagae]
MHTAKTQKGQEKTFEIRWAHRVREIKRRVYATGSPRHAYLLSDLLSRPAPYSSSHEYHTEWRSILQRTTSNGDDRDEYDIGAHPVPTASDYSSIGATAQFHFESRKFFNNSRETNPFYGQTNNGNVAHCLKDDGENIPPSMLVVSLGRFDLYVWDEQGSLNVDVLEYKIHPDYVNPLSADSDLAIIKLMDRVEYTPRIRPLCLWMGKPDLDRVVGTFGYVVGWSKDQNKRQSNEPRMSKAPIVSQEDCLRSNVAFLDATSNRTFCAGTRDGGGSCIADSGSGFVMYHTRISRYHLRGIVSLSTIDARTRYCDYKEYVVYVDIANEEIDEAIKIIGDFLRSEKGIEWLAESIKERKSQLTTIDLVINILETPFLEGQVWDAAKVLKETLELKNDSVDLNLNKKGAKSNSSEENWNNAVTDVEGEDDILCLYRKNSNNPQMKKSEDWRKLLDIAPGYTIHSVTDKGSKYLICLKKINITETLTTTLPTSIITTLPNLTEEVQTSKSEINDNFDTMHSRSFNQTASVENKNSTENFDNQTIGRGLNRHHDENTSNSGDDFEEDCSTSEQDESESDVAQDISLKNVTSLYSGKSFNHLPVQSRRGNPFKEEHSKRSTRETGMDY